MSTIAEEVEVLRGARSATFKDLLTHRAFARLLAAMSVSSFGDWVGFVAVTSIVASLGGGTASLAVSGVMIARTLPAFLFGPIAGTLVDRLDRKRLMIVADLARGALYVSMVFLRELWRSTCSPSRSSACPCSGGRRETHRCPTSSRGANSRTRTRSSC